MNKEFNGLPQFTNIKGFINGAWEEGIIMYINNIAFSRVNNTTWKKLDQYEIIMKTKDD